MAFTQPKEMTIAYEVMKEFNKYNLTIEEAEKTMKYMHERAFMANRNKCLRENKKIFEATASAGSPRTSIN